MNNIIRYSSYTSRLLLSQTFFYLFFTDNLLFSWAFKVAQLFLSRLSNHRIGSYQLLAHRLTGCLLWLFRCIVCVRAIIAGPSIFYMQWRLCGRMLLRMLMKQRVGPAAIIPGLVPIATVVAALAAVMHTRIDD